MAALTYAGLTSLDGFVNDADGDFGWAEPEPEVHQLVNDQQRSAGTHLYGRRLYEVMTYWQTAETDGDATSPIEQDYARIWQRADKIVFSSTLTAVSTPRTTLERTFDPAAVRRWVDQADRDVVIGGATLGCQALAAGIVDEVIMYLAPVVIGAGTAFLPDTRIGLDLVETRRFPRGTVLLRYRVARSR